MAIAESNVRRRPVLMWLAAIAMTAAACTSDESAEVSVTANTTVAAVEPESVPNQGGSLEGHTPRGFPGSGTGLFAGDELNTNFPADDGVQIWLTFEIPETAATSTAVLRSDALTVRGNPLDTLGSLEVAPVQFDSFGPAVVALEPIGPSVTCPMPEGSTFTCDVTDTVRAARANGASRVQLRLRFEEASDLDGEQDLAMFFLTDSNTNEPGIFQLVLG